MSTMCQGFSHLQVCFLHHFVLAKLATNSIRVKYISSILFYLEKDCSIEKVSISISDFFSFQFVYSSLQTSFVSSQNDHLVAVT